MPALTLKELCCKNIIKYGVSWEVLPDKLVEEIEKMELKIMYAFNGRFLIVEDYASSELAISWRAGEWHFNMLNVGTIRIVGGVHNDLGKLGGALFLFPQREVIISDFHMDVDHRYINFTFNEAGGGCQNTGTLAKFGQKTGTFSYFQYILTYF